MSEPTDDTFLVDELAVEAAMMQVAAAEKTAHAAEEKAGLADDALADAADAVTVAEAKVDDYTSDDAKLPWQIAAAQSELAKKTRAHARAERQHEQAHRILDAALSALAVAVEALELAKNTPVGDDEDGEPIALLAWSVPLTTAPAELVEWVEGTFQDYLTGSVGMVPKSGRWCTRWVEHPDAVHRLAGIYDEWTLMRLRVKGAPSLHAFYREILDYHLPQLTSREYGVFQRCDLHGHEPHTRIDTD